ncbi:hypothetical protein GCM10022393_24430 [Aquimarina addita]|uniref:Outer membrane protein beta-barrel domain-containing protein n=1 Tax=Aquimarina addita TaxID=870485 RepID=A0ABP6UKN0_9FLAO
MYILQHTIDKKIIEWVCIAFFALCSYFSQAQNFKPQITPGQVQDSLTPLLKKNAQFGTEKQISVRAGVGLQDSFYTEFGLALHTCNYSDVGFFSNDFYTAIEWVPNQDIYGIKIGYEANTFIFLLNTGFEIKYQTDFDKNDIVITPKLGFGIFGDVNIFYGYNFSTRNNPFPQVANHQISIVFNFNKHFLQYR